MQMSINALLEFVFHVLYPFYRRWVQKRGMGSKFVYQTEPAAAKDAFMALNQSSLKRKSFT